MIITEQTKLNTVNTLWWDFKWRNVTAGMECAFFLLQFESITKQTVIATGLLTDRTGMETSFIYFYTFDNDPYKQIHKRAR